MAFIVRMGLGLVKCHMYICIVYIVEGSGQKIVAWITSLLRFCAGRQNKKEIIAVVNALNSRDPEVQLQCTKYLKFTCP